MMKPIAHGAGKREGPLFMAGRMAGGILGPAPARAKCAPQSPAPAPGA